MDWPDHLCSARGGANGLPGDEWRITGDVHHHGDKDDLQKGNEREHNAATLENSWCRQVMTLSLQMYLTCYVWQ